MFSSLTLAALAALGWGLSEFVAGHWARRLPVAVVLGWSKVAGMVFAGAVVAVLGTAPPRDGALWWAVVAGLISVPSMALLYLALRHGSMAVVAPVAALAAAVPLIWSLAHGEPFTVDDAVGVVAVLAGVTLVSWPQDRDPRSPARIRLGIAYALGSALGFGAFYVLLHEASTADPIWSTAVVRLVAGVAGIAVLVGYAVRRRRTATGPRAARETVAARPRRRPGRVITVVVAVGGVGLADAAADGAFALASTRGALGSAAVLSSLYPAVTVLLGVWLLRERLEGLRAVGVAAALAGGAFMAA